jgi:beta-ureidopropionase / N-carbamoyl-L-amino-acid hydrolase
MQVNIERLKETLLDLSAIGFNDEDKGIYRLGFSKEDFAARNWLKDILDKEGFAPRMDGAGNVFGQYGTSGAPTVTVGSHLDSVPAGGIFDGSLGVIAALEILRVCKENKLDVRYPIELVATSEEEGRFGGMLGSQAMAGVITPEFLLNAHDPDGFLLADAMKGCGLEPLKALEARRTRDTMHAFLELHIEQGPVLFQSDTTIGIVDNIAGVFKWIVHLKGKADHAGTAPMHMRSDAFMGLADFAHEIPRIIAEHGTERSRLTVGKVELRPGNPHTIPGEAVFTLVGRDSSNDVMLELCNACSRVLSSIARRNKLMFEYEQSSWLDPVDCNAEIIDLFEARAKDAGLNYQRMPSGAGHDTQFMTLVCPAGMIFVPSVGGVSHAPDEWTHWEDIETGCNLLLATALELAEPH